MSDTRIRRLPDHLVNKIAAGEVVERPASVVKELVENALDAESATIVVELKDAGRQLIRVIDDGTGMTAEEVDLALLRHATSKLATDADLDAIATLGFRGEALPAICAVTRFVVLSCRRGSAMGTRVRGEGGVVSDKLLVDATAGTTVEAEDLFFNTPARLKFLKSPHTELAHALRLLQAIALAQPEIHFRVTHNGKTVLTAPRARMLRDRIGALLGFELGAKMLDVRGGLGSVAVSGLIVPPQLARGNRDDMTLIVNGRPVRDTLLVQTLLDAYRPLLARDRFPVAALRIDLPSPEVDVNVHPTKAWVRFRSPRMVQEALYTAVQETLRSSRVVRPQPGLTAGGEPPAALDAVVEPIVSGASPSAAPGLFQEESAPFGSARFGTVIGQLQDTFIVAASDAEVFFIDQHVAHERVLFERLQRDLRDRPLPSQELLFPQPLELGPGRADLLGQWTSVLGSLGFALEAFGGSTALLRAVPALLKGEEPRRLIEGLLDEVGGPPRDEAAPPLHRALAFVACRAAIKAHAALQRDEMARLLIDLSATETPYFCPHGRPIVSRLSLREIKRELGRTW
ncbi:MAG TPA: DNA mismatch repair endonuclease MutL [Methylomirabilota bacterium]|jgi:DNA mismatch repair protein MutL|nr:DNA mismatch repair endonuclease MutL [Methylomirabilota bacterium]